MGAWDFVVGILAGIVLACVSFVLQTSRVSAVRNSLPGSIAASTVRRHPLQNRFLQDAGKQIYVMKLAGYLFFGTIVGVEKQIRTLLLERFEREPIRFLILDLQNVDGVDFSAAEAFTRINRILKVKGVALIICGISMNGEIGTALCNVGLFEGADTVQFFETLNSALEHCENDLLLSLYQQRAALSEPISGPAFLSRSQSWIDLRYFGLADAGVHRRTQTKSSFSIERNYLQLPTPATITAGSYNSLPRARPDSSYAMAILHAAIPTTSADILNGIG